MKKSELTVGKVYAYSRKTVQEYSWDIAGFIVDDLDPKLAWKEPKGSIAGRFVKSDGTPQENQTKVLPRFIVGDFEVVKLKLENREANRKIAQLNTEIANSNVRTFLDMNSKELAELLELKSTYYIANNYKGQITITLTAGEAQDLLRKLRGVDNLKESLRMLRNELAIKKAQEEINA